MNVVRNAHRQELYNQEIWEGWREGEPEREKEEGMEGGRGKREIFFHCMPAAALISWSILVTVSEQRQPTMSLKGRRRWKVVFSST